MSILSIQVSVAIVGKSVILKQYRRKKMIIQHIKSNEVELFLLLEFCFENETVSSLVSAFKDISPQWSKQSEECVMLCYICPRNSNSELFFRFRVRK